MNSKSIANFDGDMFDNFPVGAKGRVRFSSTPFHKLQVGECACCNVSAGYASAQLKKFAEIMSKGQTADYDRIMGMFDIRNGLPDNVNHSSLQSKRNRFYDYYSRNCAIYRVA